MHISINNGVNNVLIESNSASKLRLAAYIRVSTESEEQESDSETRDKVGFSPISKPKLRKLSNFKKKDLLFLTSRRSIAPDLYKPKKRKL